MQTREEKEFSKSLMLLEAAKFHAIDKTNNFVIYASKIKVGAPNHI